MSSKYVLKRESSSHAFSIAYDKELNATQLDVVKNGDGPTLVLAGAGSGKTRTLIFRVAYLLEKGVHPEEILLVTFTNKAAEEMKSRVESLLHVQSRGLWCGTFHHIANRLLRKYGKAVGLDSDFGILDDEDSRDLVKACAKSLEKEFAATRMPKPGVLQSVLSFSANSQKPLLHIIPKHYPHFLQLLPFFEKMRLLYEERKRNAQSLDYDDLLVYWLRLLKDNREMKELLSNQFRYCMVDEYQDTNKIQHEIVCSLASKHKNLLVVGDDAQSIYSFRAATIRNILDFPSDFSDCKTFRLESNYRSTGAILKLANQSISMNREQFPKKLKSMREEGEKPQMVRAKDPRQQAEFITQRIAELREEGVNYGEIAVLFRAHYQAAELELELAKRGIEYLVRGGVRFFEQAHIKDTLSYLRLISNPMDEVAWIRALTLYPGIGAGYADKIYLMTRRCEGDLSKVASPEFAQELPARPRQGFQQFQSTLKRLLHEQKRERPDLLIEEVMEQGYAKHILLHFENARDRSEDIRQLINFSHSYKTLKSFLADTMLREGFKGESFMEGYSDDKDAEAPLILSTIHQAKGLEWKAVFVIGLAEGQFPHAKSLQSEEELEEERRLFYVACTRAKDRLFLTYPLMRYDYQAGMVINRPSAFLQELGSGVYDEVEIEEDTGEPTIYLDDQA